MNQQPAEQDSTRYWAQPSTSASDCRLVDDAIDEYALGVADPERQVAIERHVLRCQRCSALVDGYQATAAALGLSVPMIMPPAGTRTLLMARIAATPQDVAIPAVSRSIQVDSFRTPTLPASTQSAAPSSQPQPNANAWWRVYAAPLATLPLLLALGLVGAWGFNNYAKLNDANNVIAMQDQTLANMNGQLEMDDQQVVELAFSPSSKRYPLTSDMASQESGSWGTLLANPVTGQAALQVEGLSSGSYTVLVQTRDGSMLEKAVFFVGADGTASTAIDLGDQVTDFQSVHIRENNVGTESDVAVEGEVQDVLMAVIGPDITQGSGTSLKGQ